MARKTLARSKTTTTRQRAKVKNTVAAIILREDHAFLVEKRRDDDDSDPGFVAIPGGHVEAGESFDEALKREMKEELGIKVLKAKAVHVDNHTTTSGERDRIHYYLVHEWKGKIVSHEAQRVYWESDPTRLTARTDRDAIKRTL